ncbi:MAG TPA: CBS domain-containing protein [Pyrinomonadaceae bacterium]|nr:CBS domain-containing protein [Pyrinomonadaceae bacterium]
MLLYSKLRRFALIDEKGRRAKLIDFIVDLLPEGYPRVTHILFRDTNRKREVLPWDAVISIDHLGLQIKVKDVEAGELAPEEWLKKRVLLSDVHDALILDLEHLRAARANGLLLKEEDGSLLLCGIDTSLSATLRWLTGGRFGYVPKATIHDWTAIEFLRGDPQAVKRCIADGEGIAQLPAGEIARLASQLPYMHAAELVMLLPDALAINTLEAMTARRRLQIFEELTEPRALRMLELMAPDVAADLMGTLQTETMEGFLDRLPEAQSKRIIDLLRYPEHSVGGIMTNDIVFAPMRMTIAEARQKLRERLKEPDFVHLIFIVDDETAKRQQGIVPIRYLLTADDNQTLEEIMDKKVISLDALESAQDASFKVIESQLAALPVVGPDGQLLGAVTVDAAVLQAAPEAWGSQAPRIFS